MTKPNQPPEAALIASRRAHRSVRSVAKLARISEGRWRQLEAGYSSAGRGQYVGQIAPADTLARMAQVVGVSPAELREVHREDAAAVLADLPTPGALGDLEVGWFDELRDIPDEVLAAEVARRLLGSHLSQQNPIEDAVRIHGALTALFDRPSTLVTSLTERRDRAAGAAGQQTVEDELPEEFEEAAYRPAQPPGPVEE